MKIFDINACSHWGRRQRRPVAMVIPWTQFPWMCQLWRTWHIWSGSHSWRLSTCATTCQTPQIYQSDCNRQSLWKELCGHIRVIFSAWRSSTMTQSLIGSYRPLSLMITSWLIYMYLHVWSVLSHCTSWRALGLVPSKGSSRELHPGVDSCQGLLCLLPRTSTYIPYFLE